MNTNFLTGIFHGFCLLFRNTYLAVFVHFSREASQGSNYFLGKYCPREYLNVKILHSKLFQGECLFLGGSTYLLVSKLVKGSSHFPVNNY